jgi:pimeloyl-ACP methyl ester carboxylesterase
MQERATNGQQPTQGLSPAPAAIPPGVLALRPGQRRATAHVIHYHLSYVQQGTGDPRKGALLLLHGLPIGNYAWRNVLPLLQERPVIAPDMLGYGLSDRPWVGDVSIWGHGDALAFLIRQLDLRDLTLVGFDLGGGVAQVLATRLVPDRVRAMVLINTLCYERTFAPDWPLPEMVKRQEPDAPRHTPIAQMLADLRATLPAAVYDQERFQRALDDYAGQWDSELGKQALFQQIRQLDVEYMRSVASDLRVFDRPALVIWSEQDQITPLKYAQRLARELPHSRLEIIPNAGHLILEDAPETVGRIIAQFVAQIDEVRA